jgi:hypothetical protein
VRTLRSSAVYWAGPQYQLPIRYLLRFTGVCFFIASPQAANVVLGSSTGFFNGSKSEPVCHGLGQHILETGTNFKSTIESLCERREFSRNQKLKILGMGAFHAWNMRPDNAETRVRTDFRSKSVEKTPRAHILHVITNFLSCRPQF